MDWHGLKYARMRLISHQGYNPIMNSGSSISYLIPPFIAFAVSLGTISYLIKGNILKILDQPNSRSLHTRPVPRTGGLGLMAGIFVSWTFLPVKPPVSIWIAVVLLVTISFADDVRSLPVWPRLAIYAALGTWFSAVTLAATYGWLVAVAAALGITWMLNLYNFMDGSDGLAGGMTLIGFSCYGATAWISGNEAFAIANFCIAAAAGAFLLFNFHPARIFMGDAGSIPLGFLAAALGMMGWINGCWPPWFPLLVFSPFIVDASVTLIKRGVRGEKIWRAHREHYYQRLVRSGLGHRNTALIGYVLMSATAISALWATRQHTNVQFGMVTAWIGIYLVMICLCDRRLRHTPDSP